MERRIQLVANHLLGLPVVVLVGLAAVGVGIGGFAVLQWRASRVTIPIAFWYEDKSLILPPAVVTALGGPLSDDETDVVVRISRGELQKAFAGLRIRVTDSKDGFWRVTVVQTLPIKGQLPNAGETLPLGPLGGRALVGSDVVSLNAVHYAPPGASRRTIIEALGRGLGRVAVHELAHQIVGVAASHNDTDEHSYEYPSPARAAQYYGELHWTTWWPVLQRKIGS